MMMIIIEVIIIIIIIIIIITIIFICPKNRYNTRKGRRIRRRFSGSSLY